MEFGHIIRFHHIFQPCLLEAYIHEISLFHLKLVGCLYILQQHIHMIFHRLPLQAFCLILLCSNPLASHSPLNHQQNSKGRIIKDHTQTSKIFYNINEVNYRNGKCNRRIENALSRKNISNASRFLGQLSLGTLFTLSSNLDFVVKPGRGLRNCGPVCVACDLFCYFDHSISHIMVFLFFVMTTQNIYSTPQINDSVRQIRSVLSIRFNNIRNHGNLGATNSILLSVRS